MLTALLTITWYSCDEEKEVITDLTFDRLFAPIGIETTIINDLDFSVTWSPVYGAEKYIVELYANDNIIFDGTNRVVTDTLTTTSFNYSLDYDIEYTLRLKASAEGINDSKWNTKTFKTKPLPQ